MKILTTLILTAALVTFSQQLHMDSVTVDSVWVSDSSWYNGVGILQQRHSRDCKISFIPQGTGIAQCFVSFSLDSGLTWWNHPESLSVLNNGLNGYFICGNKVSITTRVLGADRLKSVFRMTARQYAPTLNPQLKVLGMIAALTPGQSVGASLTVTQVANTAQASIAKVWWDAFADGSWDDSTAALNWVWQTTVPQGAAGQRRAVIAKARDVNGLWSNLDTMTVQFGLVRPLAMVNIPAGTFQMGDAAAGATPVHPVTLSAYTMMNTQVTQEQFTAVMGYNPSFFASGSSYPVETVTWFDAVLFCNALSKASGFDTCYTYTSAAISGTGNSQSCSTLVGISCDFTKAGYRLPTEAEYEYACRGGTTTSYFWGNDTNGMGAHTWSYVNGGGTTHPVATLAANPYSLYDITGNVFEWCWDWETAYTSAAVTNPTGPAAADPTYGSYRVWRGGSWSIFIYGFSDVFLSAYRNYYIFPHDRFNYCGFRAVRGVH